MTDLAGARALVTGASGGIGAAMTRAFQAAGATVHGFDRAPQATPGVTLHAVDLRDAAALEQAVGEVEARLGGIDVLVNNAAVLPFRAIEDTDDATLAETIEVNLLAVYRLCRRLYPGMRARRAGVIVNVASELATVGLPGYTAYCASKGAVLALTRALALEAAPHGVRVNALCPGPTDTAMMDAEIAAAPSPAAARAAMLASVPLGRLARPEEIADVAVFLAGPRASFVHGAAILADGGRTAV